MREELTFAVAAVGLGLVLIRASLPPLWRGLASRRWARAHGRIVSVDLAYANGPRGFWPTPVISYWYTVAGQRYVGTRINYAGFAHEEARTAFERYDRKQAVEVWYDPRDPTRAVLEPGITVGMALWVFISIIVLGSGVVALSGIL